MLARVQAQLYEIRLDLRGRQLRHRERLACRRLGEAIAREGAGAAGGDQTLARLAGEVAEGERRIAALTAEGDASIEADRADLRVVSPWVKPVVALRGLCTRHVLRHRRWIERGALRPQLEALGELAAALAGPMPTPGAHRREIAEVRGQQAAVIAERKRWGAPYGGRALPDWTEKASGEVARFGRALLTQLRSHLLPKGPAIAGLAVGWWIANTYTDSHFRSALRSLGIGSGGTRVVSSSTYDAMTFWLPLLAAALCAYLGERLASFYRGRGPADT